MSREGTVDSYALSKTNLSPVDESGFAAPIITPSSAAPSVINSDTRTSAAPIAPTYPTVPTYDVYPTAPSMIGGYPMQPAPINFIPQPTPQPTISVGTPMTSAYNDDIIMNVTTPLVPPSATGSLTDDLNDLSVVDPTSLAIPSKITNDSQNTINHPRSLPS